MPPKQHEPEEETMEPVKTVEEPETAEDQPKPVKTKFIFPDIDGGGPSVTIEATSIEEATALFQKGQAHA